MFDHIVEIMHGERLLLGPDAHVQQLLDRIPPRLIMLHEGIVLQGVCSPFDVDLFERMRGQLVVHDVLRGHAEERSGGHTEITVDVSGVARADLECAVDVEHAVRIAVHECIDGKLELVGESPDKTPTGPRGHAPHRNKNAIGRAPVAVLDETLKHARGLYGQNEFSLGLEFQVLDRDRDGVRSRTEFGTVDTQGFAAVRLAVDHDELAGDLAALFFGDESELLAIDLEQSLDIVDDGIRFRLLIEARLVPVLGDVVGLSLGHDFVVFDERLGLGHHPKRLGECLDRGDGERAGLFFTLEFEETLFRMVLDVTQGPQRER